MKVFFLVVVVFLASTLVESEEVKEVNNPKIIHDAVDVNNPMIQSRIIRGTPATYGAYPYHVRLTMTGSLLVLPIINLGQCGGSIIGRNWVLTAAHCLDTRTQVISIPVVSVTVEAGGRTTSQFRQTKTVGLSDFHRHPEYESTFRSNDFALLRTSSWDFTDPFVQPIKLPQQSLNIDLYTGQTAVATGFGPTSNDNPDTPSTTLQYINLVVLSKDQCFPQWGYDMARSAFCAQDPRSPPKGSVCTSDLGGPLALTDNGTAILIGVASMTHYMEGCDGTAQGFQMVARVMDDWITPTTGLTALMQCC